MEDKEYEKEQGRQLSVSSKTLFIILGVISLGLLMLGKILANFGVTSAVLFGILTVLIYGTSFAGMVCSYMTDKKVSFEFWVNLVAFALAVFTF
ncbi:MAG: hypothetical protein J6T74_01870 [Clostridia bacterium]|nr:hypothetical protein [Clostridia bacterium]